MPALFAWLVRFLTFIFGGTWRSLVVVLLKILSGPAAFFLFKPLFAVSGHIASYIFDQIAPSLNQVGLTADGLAAWFIHCLKLQECVAALVSFLVLGFMISTIKALF